MGYYKYLIKQIIKKIPFKLLIIILITLFILSICISPSFCANLTGVYSLTYSYNNTNFKVNCYGEGKGFVLVVNSDYVPKYIYYVGSGGGSNSFVYYESTNELGLKNNSWCGTYNFNSNTNTYEFSGSTRVSNTVTLPSGYFPFYSDQNIYNSSNNIYLSADSLNFVDTFLSPSITTSSTYVQNWSFDNLVIDCGDVTGRYSVTESGVTYQYVRDFRLETTYNGVVYTLNCRPYLSIDNDNKATITIPKNVLSNFFNLYNGQNIVFDLFVQPDDEPNSTGNWSIYSLGTYTLSLTSTEENQYNSDSDKQLLGDINQSVQSLNTSINNNFSNLDNTLTDSSFNSNELSNTMHNFGNGFVVTDNTHLEELFVMLYNAFCNNQVVNVTFTIPFVNKIVTISSSNVSAYYPQAITSIVNLFVWGVIGLYIIKDIRSMINKMAEGNVENISHDVKKEVL